MTAKIPDPLLSSEIFTLVFGGTFDSFPADENQAGMLSALAGDGEMRSAGIVTDAGNLMLSIDDIECGENLLVIASTYNEALFDPDDGKLSGAVFTKWLGCVMVAAAHRSASAGFVNTCMS
ncbi:hypothetical protein [Cryobacterium sp. M15]|jgi:hypothetical protein|uniref:hypothetical protein n=1 Tax=Cryobacterium sp. M15 TaxID=2048291 RepID=UPI000CE44F11|nr:hypothetical protein [Cryobacterium sp. M15]